MTYRQLLLLSTTLFIVSCKDYNDLTIYDLHGKVKTIEETFYFAEEKFGEWKIGEKLSFSIKREYDENGFRYSYTSFDRGDSIQEKTIYEWVKENEGDYYKHPTKKGIVYNSDGKVKEIEMTKYNFKGEESSLIYRVITTFLPSSETLSVRYDFVNEKNGLVYKSVIEEYKNVGSNDSLNQFVYVTDYHNRLEEASVKLDSETTSKGILIKDKHIDYLSSYLVDNDFESPLTPVTILKTQYLEFDKNKNWIKAVDYLHEKNIINVRKITYYN